MDFQFDGILPQSQFLAWGWRIPFLLGTVLAAAGFIILLKVSESPEFERTVAIAGVVRARFR